MSLLSQLARATGGFSLEGVRAELQSVQSRLGTLRPPQEFFNFRRFSRPAHFGEAQTRIAHNLRYYSSNYGLVVGCLSVYSLLTNLLLLFVLVFTGLGIVGIGKLQGADLTTPFGTFRTSQLYTGLLCVAVPLGFLASPIATLLWLVGASAITVVGHAALMEKPIETVFEEESV